MPKLYKLEAMQEGVLVVILRCLEPKVAQDLSDALTAAGCVVELSGETKDRMYDYLVNEFDALAVEARNMFERLEAHRSSMFTNPQNEVLARAFPITAKMVGAR